MPAKIDTLHHAFNVGVVDREKQHRTDLLRLRLAADQQTNFMARITGEMYPRPGQAYLGAIPGPNLIWPFFKSATEKANLEFTDQLMRVWVDDALVTRPSVTSTVTNGDFADATGWTTSGGATVNTSDEQLELSPTARGVKALCKRSVSTSSAGTEHALRIVVTRGPVTFRCGSTDGGEDYIYHTNLDTGTHSLAFTPSGGTYYIQFEVAPDDTDKIVESIAVEAAGVMTLPTLWGEDDLGLLRFITSYDVVFVAASGYPQQQIKHRGATSWSVTSFDTKDGPFQAVPVADLRLSVIAGTPSGYALEASEPFFSTEHVGTLFRLFSEGAHIEQSLGAEETYTDPIRVVGIGTASDYNDRDWSYTITGTWSGTLRVYRSFDGPDSGYQPFRRASGVSTVDITANATFTNDDEDDNAITWYRIGFEKGNFTSGVANIEINYDGPSSSAFGYCRIKEVTSATVAQIEILDASMNVEAVTSDWQEGDWGALTGYPAAVTLTQERLIWARDRLWLSISDGYYSHDETFEGDAGPINKAITAAGASNAVWMLSMKQLLIGTDTTVIEAKAASTSSIDAIITPQNLALRAIDNVGCAPITPIQVGEEALYVDDARTALYIIRLAGTGYTSTPLSRITTDIFKSGIKNLAIQRKPDTRAWVTLENGQAVCIIIDPGEEVLGFIPMETDGEYQCFAVQADIGADRVYASVKRTIDGNDVYYMEKQALDEEVKTGTLCKVMDAYKIATPSGTTVSGADHLEGEQVVAWCNGEPIVDENGDGIEFTVTSGSFDVPDDYADTELVYGLGYTCRYRSARLGYGFEGVTPTLKRKKLDSAGMLLTDYVRAGVRYGTQFDNADHPLKRLPENRGGTTAPAIVSNDVVDEEPFTTAGRIERDPRVCIEVKSPNTATFLSLVLGITTVE